MPRRKKSDTKSSETVTDLSIQWVKSVSPVSRIRSFKYIPILERLKENPGKIALLASGLEAGVASSRVVSLKAASAKVDGKFRFPSRRSPEDGLYSVFGICEEA